MMVLLYFTMI